MAEITEENANRILALVRRIHSTVRLGKQTGPYAYAGENFGQYLREATEHCEEIIGIIGGPDATA